MTSTHVSPVPCDLEEEDNRLKFRVCMMGDAQVGKTSLVTQCLTSEYMNTYDASMGKLLYLLNPLIHQFTQSITVRKHS